MAHAENLICHPPATLIGLRDYIFIIHVTIQLGLLRQHTMLLVEEKFYQIFLNN